MTKGFVLLLSKRYLSFGEMLLSIKLITRKERVLQKSLKLKKLTFKFKIYE